ncbi:MAG: hypothetical protein JRG97_04945 [Deltaproteobacteria bacterium]|nr:hypothetical protein [Deltaproteobacteria bacterium]
MSDNVYIIGVGMIKFGKNFEKSMKAMTGESLQLALDDCGLTKDDIQAAWFSNSGWGMSEFQHSIRGQVALAANGLDKVSIINVENACASGSWPLAPKRCTSSPAVKARARKIWTVSFPGQTWKKPDS